MMWNAGRGNEGTEAERRRHTLETLRVAARHEVQRFLLIRYDIDIAGDARLDEALEAQLHDVDDPARPWELELTTFVVSGHTVRLGVDDDGNLYVGPDAAGVIRSRRELIAHLQQFDPESNEARCTRTAGLSTTPWESGLSGSELDGRREGDVGQWNGRPEG